MNIIDPGLLADLEAARAAERAGKQLLAFQIRAHLREIHGDGAVDAAVRETAVRITSATDAELAAHAALDHLSVESAIEITYALLDHTWPQETAAPATGGRRA